MSAYFRKLLKTVGVGVYCMPVAISTSQILDQASRSTQSAQAYLRLTVLLAEAGSISGPPQSGHEAESWM